MINFYQSKKIGQLNPDEREFLYTVVIQTKPKVSFEVGLKTIVAHYLKLLNDFGVK